MPVFLEIITRPEGQDQTDLLKVYQDSPKDWLEGNDAEGFIKAKLDSGQILLAGRFNDRLLGAMLCKQQNDGWHLSNLCVRKVTRQRSVGAQLLHRICQIADQETIDLHVAPQAGINLLANMLEKQGFNRTDQGYFRSVRKKH